MLWFMVQLALLLLAAYFAGAMLGCVVLYLSLPLTAILVLPVWGAIGLLVYFFYSRSRSHVGRGVVEVHETDADAPPQPVPPMPGAAIE